MKKQRKQEIETRKGKRKKTRDRNRKKERETREGNKRKKREIGKEKEEERRCFTSQGSSGKEHRESQGGSKRSSLDSAWRGKNDLQGKKGIRDNITDS